MSAFSENLKPLTFLLGCERSGSTWLGNILDSHEEVEFLMEPFAPYANIFPGFPHRNLYIREPSADIEEILRQGMASLHPKKYPLMYRPGRSLQWQTADRYAMQTVRWAYTHLRGTEMLKYQQWALLNLNNSKVPLSMQIQKAWPPKNFVIKELRLNLQMRMLVKAIPYARFIVIIRNPSAQLTSVRRLLEQGSLQELGVTLKTLRSYVLNNEHLRRYRKWAQDGDLDDLLVLWWVLNYEMLISDLKECGVPLLLIRHEELSADPAKWSEKIFSFLGLSMGQSVEKFLHISTEMPQQSNSPVDTFRKSADHSNTTISNASPVLADKLQRLAEGLPCIEDLSMYFKDKSVQPKQGQRDGERKCP